MADSVDLGKSLKGPTLSDAILEQRELLQRDWWWIKLALIGVTLAVILAIAFVLIIYLAFGSTPSPILLASIVAFAGYAFVTGISMSLIASPFRLPMSHPFARIVLVVCALILGFEALVLFLPIVQNWPKG